MDAITKRKVIIADDSDLIRQRIRELVDSIGHLEVISETDNGSDTLVLVNLTQPDILILDIQMPNKSGIAVLESIQDDIEDICVIILSNHSEIEYKRKCFQLGAKYFLDKTKEIDRIKQILTS